MTTEEIREQRRKELFDLFLWSDFNDYNQNTERNFIEYLVNKIINLETAKETKQ